MVIDYDGKGGGECVFSLKTLVIYEQEFGRDLIQDVIGRVSVRDDEEGTTLLDLRDTNWTATVRALWAALKTADPALPHFSDWLLRVGDVNLYEINNDVVEGVRLGFFRTRTEAGEE